MTDEKKTDNPYHSTTTERDEELLDFADACEHVAFGKVTPRRGEWKVVLTDEEMEIARSIAVGRQGIKDDNGVSTERFFQDRAEEDTIGLLGEVAFARRFGVSLDEKITVRGDEGIDFLLGGKAVDVKTARKAYNLLVKVSEVDRTLAEIFVLAQFNPPREIVFLGWATIGEMKERPKKDFGYGIVNHYKPAKILRKMDSLREVFHVEHGEEKTP